MYRPHGVACANLPANEASMASPLGRVPEPCSYVPSSDGKLCLPRKCPDVPTGEAPWVAVQTTVDGTLLCVK